MQNYKQKIFERLSNDTVIQSFVGSRVYPLQAPRPTTNWKVEDIIVYNRIGDKVNSVSVRRWTYQISVYSQTQLKADEIADRVVSLFSRVKRDGINSRIDGDLVDAYDATTKDFAVHVPIWIKSVDVTF